MPVRKDSQFGVVGIDISETVTVIDHGADFIMKQLAYLGDGVSITTGIHSEDFNKKAQYRGKSQSKTPLGKYAAYQEYGTKDAPARPFMKKTLDNNIDEFLKNTVNAMKSMYNGEITMKKILDRQASRHTKWMRAIIKNWHTPPNKPSTLQSKHGQGKTPLRDTSTMYNSIKSKIHREGGGLHPPLKKHLGIMNKNLTGSRK